MREVRVESLENVEVVGGEVRLLIPSESLEIVFAEDVWKKLPVLVSETASEEEYSEIEAIKSDLARLAGDLRFTTIMEDVSASARGFDYDLVLRSSDLYAVTTGYVFAKSEVDGKLVRDLRRSLASDDFVEQAYFICPSATDDAFAGCNDDARLVSVRDRTSSVSRFEMAPELWRTLSEARGWNNVKIPRNTDTTQRQEV